MKEHPSVAVIILNWNGWKDTIECLKSLYATSYSNLTLTLVDNGSEDNSVEKIKTFTENELKNKLKNTLLNMRELNPDNRLNIETDNNLIENFMIIRNNKNYGFAKGTNIGIRFALDKFDPDYFLFLNNDTIVDSRFIKELIKVAEQDENIGFVGPKIYNYNSFNKDNIISFSGGKLNMYKGETLSIGLNEIDLGRYNEIREVDYIEGSCILIKKNTLLRIGLLDPNYFAYWEEVDLCRRGSILGYKSVYVPKAVIWHKVSASTSDKKGFKTYYKTRNMFRFMAKHANNIQLTYFLIYYFGFRFWFLTGSYLLYHNDYDKYISFLNGVIDGLRVMIQYKITQLMHVFE